MTRKTAAARRESRTVPLREKVGSRNSEFGSWAARSDFRIPNSEFASASRPLFSHGSGPILRPLPMEAELIAWLRKRLPPHPLLRLGPGDDAAVLRMAGVEECVVTVDMLTDHVDFELARDDPRRVGRKCLAVNLSDLAAMASRPLAAVIAVVLPRQGGMELAVELIEGLLPLAERYDVAIAGGDVNSWDGPLAVSVTLLGQVTGRGPLCRGGARPGDQIVVTGSVRRQHPRPPLRLRAPRGRGPVAQRPLRVARRHRRQRRPGHRPFSRGRRERLRGGPPDRRRADQRGCPAAGRPSGRGAHGAGARPGRRRGFRVDPGRAARRGPPHDCRAAAGGRRSARSGNLSPSRDLWQRTGREEPTPLEVRGWQHRFD